MTPLRLAVGGCCGRMGSAVLRLAGADPRFQVVAAVTEPGDARIGGAVQIARAPDLRIAGSLGDAACDVWIDFTNPAGCIAAARVCRERRIRLVSGTTGLSAGELDELASIGRETAVVWSANMSVGVNLLAALVRAAAARLADGWDVEIVESHHRAKLDAPSGTARLLLDAAKAGRADGRRADRDSSPVVHGRHHDRRPREPDEIGVHAVRLGGVIGEHDVHFGSDGEVVTLRHRALSRDVFAAGALRAAVWIAERAAGFYHMRDVLA